MKTILITVVGLIFGFAANGMAVIIDFGAGPYWLAGHNTEHVYSSEKIIDMGLDPADYLTYYGAVDWNEDGFHVESTYVDGSFDRMDTDTWVHQAGNANFSGGFANSMGSDLILTAVDGSSFTFSGFAGGEGAAGASTGSYYEGGISVIGVRQDNSTVQESFRLDGLWSSHFLTVAQYFTPSRDFSNIIALSFSPYGTIDQYQTPNIYFSIDNIDVAMDPGIDNPEVPEPATLLLFGTGLSAFAAVGQRRRKRTLQNSESNVE